MRNSRKTHIGIYSAKIFLQIFFNTFIYDFEICPFLKLTENERKHVISNILSVFCVRRASSSDQAHWSLKGPQG